MRRLLVILGCIVVFLVCFWLGLMLYFPGESVSRYVEAEVNRFGGVTIALSPAQLRWSGLYVPRAELLRVGNEKAAPLFTFTDIVIPLSWRLVRGLPVRGVIGKTGDLEAFVPWSQGGDALVDGRVVFQEIPVPPVFQPIALQGRLRFSGHFRMDAPAQMRNQLPVGMLEGHGEGLQLSGVKVHTILVPVTHLDALDVEVTSGRDITVRNFTFRGDLQGKVQGRITPNVRNPRLSVLALRITAAFRNDWVARLGNIRPLVESFLDRGRLVLALDGTVGNPRLHQVKGR